MGSAHPPLRYETLKLRIHTLKNCSPPNLLQSQRTNFLPPVRTLAALPLQSRRMSDTLSHKSLDATAFPSPPMERQEVISFSVHSTNSMSTLSITVANDISNAVLKFYARGP